MIDRVLAKLNSIGSFILAKAVYPIGNVFIGRRKNYKLIL